MAPASVRDLVSRDQNKTRCQELLSQVGSTLKKTSRKVRQTNIVLELDQFFQAAVDYMVRSQQRHSPQRFELAQLLLTFLTDL